MFCFQRICLIFSCGLLWCLYGQLLAAPSLSSDIAYYQRRVKTYSLNLNDRLFILSRIRAKYQNTGADLSWINKEISYIQAKRTKFSLTDAHSALIQAHDVLTIEVSPANEFSRTVTVDKQGYLELDLMGAVMVSGKTPSQAARDIAQRLSHFIVDPTVRVTLQAVSAKSLQPSSKNISIQLLGGFPRPGTFSVPRSSLLMNVMSAHGGIADMRRVKPYIFRLNQAQKRISIAVNIRGIIRNTIPDIPLQQDDIVWISDNGKPQSWISSTLLPWGTVVMIGIIIGLLL
jgi:protein involved in polysaccharide export with SLBB domain